MDGGFRARAVLAAALVALVVPVSGRADEGDPADDVRVERACSERSRAALRVRAREDDALRVEIDVRTRARNAAWNVVLVHERRLVFRVRARTGTSSRAFSLRRTIPDWPGVDQVTVRATGPGGELCRATARLAAG